MATFETERPVDLDLLTAELGAPVECRSALSDLEQPGQKFLTADVDPPVLAAAVANHEPPRGRARRRAAIRDAVRLIAANADTAESWAALTPAVRAEAQRLAVRALLAALVDLYGDA